MSYFIQIDRGHPVILISSGGREASGLNERAATLVTAGYRTIAIEQPGIGGSELPQLAIDRYDLVDDSGDIIQDSEETTPCTIGLSIEARDLTTRFTGGNQN